MKKRDDEKEELEKQVIEIKSKLANQEIVGGRASIEVKASAERDKEEIERLRKEVEDKRARLSLMVSARELADERDKRKHAEFEAKKKLDEVKRESKMKNDMAASRSRTLEKEMSKMMMEMTTKNKFKTNKKRR